MKQSMKEKDFEKKKKDFQDFVKKSFEKKREIYIVEAKKTSKEILIQGLLSQKDPRKP